MGAQDKRELELRFPARADQLSPMREALRESVQGCGCDGEATADIVMAVDEACQNIIRHAYGGRPGGEIVLEVDREGRDLVFTLRDFAPKIDPAKVKPRDLDDIRPGGLGTHLIRTVMDEVEFAPPPSGRGNLLKMVKRIG